jgi:hypothetical protein
LFELVIEETPPSVQNPLLHCTDKLLHLLPARNAPEMHSIIAKPRTLGAMCAVGANTMPATEVAELIEQYSDKLLVVGSEVREALAGRTFTQALWIRSFENLGAQISLAASRIPPYCYSHDVLRFRVPNIEAFGPQRRAFLERVFSTQDYGASVRELLGGDRVLEQRLWRSLEREAGLKSPHELITSVRGLRGAYAIRGHGMTVKQAAEFSDVNEKQLRRALQRVFRCGAAGVRAMSMESVIRTFDQSILRDPSAHPKLPEALFLP